MRYPCYKKDTFNKFGVCFPNALLLKYGRDFCCYQCSSMSWYFLKAPSSNKHSQTALQTCVVGALKLCLDALSV